MSTKPSVQPAPRERAPAAYDEANERRYRGQVDDELQFKHDKRSNLVLGRGKSLVLSSPGGLAFTLSLNDDGIITVTDTAGNVSEILLEWDTLDGRPANLASLTGSESIDNALVWGGANLAQDTGFRGGTTYWSAVKSSGSATLTGAIASSIRYGQVDVTSLSAGGNFRISGAGQRTVPVVAGDNVEIGCLVGGTSGLAFLCRVYWYNAAGSLLSASNAASQSLSLAGGGDVSTYHLVQGFATAPANAAWATPAFYATSTPSGSANIRVAGPFIAQARIGQTAVTRLEISNDFVPGADPTLTNTAAAITGQGVFALGNYYEQASDPGSVSNGSMWFKTGTNELFIRSSASWKKVSNLSPNLSLSLSPAVLVSSLGATSVGPTTGTPSGGTGPYTYAWTKISGTTLTGISTTSATTTFTGATGNASVYRLTVTDSLGATAFQDVNISFV